MLRLQSLLLLPGLALFGSLAACGGTTFDITKDASADDSGNDGASDGGAKDGAVEAGPHACGKVICQGTDYCVHPCCGGPAPQCTPLPEDGGKCPEGTTPANCQNGPGCQQLPCTPAPPYCKPTPEGCMPNGRDAICVCA